MTSNQNAGNSLARLLRARGITNGRKLADHVDAPAVIYFLAKDSDNNNRPRAELHYTRNGSRVVSTHLPRQDVLTTLSERRQETVEAAQSVARDLLGVPEWRKAPFGNCWLPRESINRMREELGSDPIE